MKKLSILTFFLSVTLSAFAQIPEYEDYLCPDATYSEYLPSNRQRKSHWVCDSDNDYWVSSFTGDTQIVSSYSVQRIADGDDHYKAKLKINWVAGREGTVFFEVKYRRYWVKCNLCSSCEIDEEKVIYKYRIDKRSTNPGGTLTGSSSVVTNDIVGFVNINLLYKPTTGTGSVPVKIRYNDGTDIIEKDVDYSTALTNGVPVTVKATSFGAYTVAVDVKNDCGDWFTGLSKVVNVYPSCYQNSSTQLRIAELPYDAEGYLVQKDIDYSIVVTGITSFSTHYYYNVQDGAADVRLSGNTFTLLTGLGSYRIDAVKKPGRELCPNISPLKIFAGGEDITLGSETSCAITIPDDLVGLGYTNTNDPSVREHFAATVISKKSITIRPGLTLALGAELDIILPDPQPSKEDPDKILNYIHAVTYDEYNRVLSEGRTYFDLQGRELQTQSKNIDAGVILTKQTIFDAYGRPAIQTLEAPTHVAKKKVDECDAQRVTIESFDFSYKPNFVKATDGSVYSFLNFDLNKQNSPEPLQSTEVGTLGWYYSANNGTLAESDESAGLQEKFVPVTSYPYKRILYKNDGTQEVDGTTRPGDVFRAGNGHVASQTTEGVDINDEFLNHYLSIRQLEFALNKPSAVTGNFFKQINIDEEGKKMVQYIDNGSHLIISLFYGRNTEPISRSYQFYDNTGRLIATITPNGIEQYKTLPFNEIDKISYKYDFQGRLIEKNEQEAGVTLYIYATDGKIRFSQNEEQRTTGKYSYINYDRLGRPIESGEYLPGNITFGSNELIALAENGNLFDGNSTGSLTNQLYTFYDIADPACPSRTQHFVTGEVSYSKKGDYQTTWYSYDEAGRVEWIVQNIRDLGVITIDYRYGPTSAVQEITYQKEVDNERFIHFYEYDDNGRIEKVYTTRDLLSYGKDGKLLNAGIKYDNNGKLSQAGPMQLEATHAYYLHGPLKRLVYANNLQGIDYLYTADGLLKSINDPNSANDPGEDGNDIFGLTLNYYSGDYSTNHHSVSTIPSPEDTQDHYTGAIKTLHWHNAIEKNFSFGYAYRYDQQNQFFDARWGSTKTGAFTYSPNNAYLERVNSYDKNGNIGSLTRNDELGNTAADFKYNYSGTSNQLSSITRNQEELIKYKYNKIGQLTEEFDVKNAKKFKIAYETGGKVTEIRNESDKLVSTVLYDHLGFRIKRQDYDADEKIRLTTWYVRGINGNLMAVYEKKKDVNVLTELPVYSNERIGLFKPRYNFTFYELKDHLGNVRAVIGDRVTAEFLATMETERAGEETDFQIPDSEATAAAFNHTPSSVTLEGTTTFIENPNEVIRINNGCSGCSQDPIGGGIMRAVYPGDKIKAEVYVKYFNFDKNNKNVTSGLVGLLANAFGPATLRLIDGTTVFQIAEQSSLGILPAAADVNDNVPKAFLNYLVFDRNLNHIGRDEVQVSVQAEIPTDVDQAQLHTHEKLFLEVEIEKEGFIYVYVSNVSDQNTDVYFDDLKVTHEYSEIVAGSDYYPFGLAIEDRKITREDHRFGYQGNSSESDTTGWNHFKLRQYDPKIARWLQRDPEGQYFSPYNAMGNNPVSGTDPTGGKNYNFSARTGAYLGKTFDVWWHNALFGTRGVLLEGGEIVETFSFSDFVQDAKAMDDKMIEGLVFVKKSEIIQMLTDAGAFKRENRENKVKFLKEAGRGGKSFDFAHVGIYDTYFGKASPTPNNEANPPRYFFLFEGTAYNQSNFGNYLFGAGGVALGFPIMALQAGAHYNSLFNSETNGYPSQFDSKDDQWSIIYGGQFANRNRLRSIEK